jgi:putative sterol carrier protein
MAENQDAAIGTEGIEGADATQLAAMVGQVPEEQLAEGMANPEGRALVLDEIFNRMAEHVEPSQIEGVDAVVHFKITDAPGGGDDVYEVVIKDGGVSINKDGNAKPRVTITVGPVPFLKLVTGHQSGPVMFMTGKLKLAGDVMFASRITSFFRIPTAAG